MATSEQAQLIAAAPAKRGDSAAAPDHEVSLLAPCHHNIGLLGSVCLIVNNVTGPGMQQIGCAYASAGWLPTTALLGACGALSALASLFLADAVASVDGNGGYGKRVELVDLLRAATGGGSRAPSALARLGFALGFWNFVALFTVSNVEAIVESVQSADKLLVAYAGASCALGVWPPAAWGFGCIARAAADTDSPFGEGQWVVSAGFCLTALVVLPLSSLGLDDNVGVQIASTALLVAILSAWCAEFAADAVGAGGGGGAGALAAGGAPPRSATASASCGARCSSTLRSCSRCRRGSARSAPTSASRARSCRPSPRAWSCSSRSAGSPRPRSPPSSATRTSR